MQLHTKPIGSEISWFPGCDIVEISNSVSGLRVVVAATRDSDRFAEIHFESARAFQVLEEGDLLGYWDPPLTAKYLVYKVEAGGWRERVADHFLQSTAPSMPEWLIVTECLCVNVLSACTPHIREY